MTAGPEGPTALPFLTMVEADAVGDAEAGLCVDGLCAVPGTPVPDVRPTERGQ